MNGWRNWALVAAGGLILFLFGLVAEGYRTGGATTETRLVTLERKHEQFGIDWSGRITRLEALGEETNRRLERIERFLEGRPA